MHGETHLGRKMYILEKYLWIKAGIASYKMDLKAKPKTKWESQAGQREKTEHLRSAFFG